MLSLLQRVHGGVCLPPTVSVPSPPATVFSYYQEHFGAAGVLCMVSGGGLTLQQYKP